MKQALILMAWGSPHIITFTKSNYADNGRLYVGMVDWDEGWPEPWSDLTVNIPDCKVSDENCAFIDTNNNGNDIIFWLMEHNLGRATARWAQSGYCSYPEFRFNTEELSKYIVNFDDDDDDDFEPVRERVRNSKSVEEVDEEEEQRKARRRAEWMKYIERLREQYRSDDEISL